MKVSRAVLSMLVVALAVGGCSKKAPPPPAPVDNSAAQAREAAERARLEAEERARREAEDRARREAEERARREAEAAAARATLEEMVFFDYDMSEIRPDAKAKLDAKLRILRQDATIRLRIEGHADDRGSNEYNMALGSRRAESVRAYLAGYGLDASRFEIVSYGEERPLARGGDEVSWAQNRRGEFRILAGMGAGGRD